MLGRCPDAAHHYERDEGRSRPARRKENSTLTDTSSHNVDRIDLELLLSPTPTIPTISQPLICDRIARRRRPRGIRGISWRAAGGQVSKRRMGTPTAQHAIDYYFTIEIPRFVCSSLAKARRIHMPTNVPRVRRSKSGKTPTFCGGRDSTKERGGNLLRCSGTPGFGPASQKQQRIVRRPCRFP